ncbi:MAG TPA: carotenoid 1,2-hydratase [Polyangiaceae bacterium]|nr:carotenoid 1,2-hydratase [Polyangiaceae bacterium]
MSDDGEHAITIIALLGSVFSPYYAGARAIGPADPLEHCAMNVGVYGARGDLWSLTERGSRRVARGARDLAIGPSSMEWDGTELRIAFDEITAPVPSRLRGRVRVRPLDVTGEVFALDAAGKHAWSPIAPVATAEVDLESPRLRFRGAAYFDANAGDEPLEQAFSSWTWSRSSRAGETAVTYDVLRADGSRGLLAKVFGAGGAARDLGDLQPMPLGRTRWGVDRSIQVDGRTSPRLLRTLEDTPFYARSLASASFGGQASTVVHEALSLDRFKQGWVRFLLPFRMRREPG